MPTWPCGLRRLPIAPAYRIAGSNPRQELEVSSHSTPFKSAQNIVYSILSYLTETGYLLHEMDVFGCDEAVTNTVEF
ncbi:hypothetical protein AVEN_167179-1 [Araneus ventricosus]|uniref:Uncharacterized protein n=1 Tax=Araneus ventricosus TaxID=182803 RepID=A0A4Y2JCD0_ARAVE|nr:hypothetical protein AVEN_167179-1 [Araneus ventricosus]